MKCYHVSNLFHDMISRRRIWPSLKAYLESFKGASLKAHQAEKHACQVSYILEIIVSQFDHAHDEIADLMERKILHKEWLPNTGRTYLNSLKLYTRYLITLASIGQNSCDVPKLQAINASISNWSKSLIKKEIMRPKDTVSNLVNPDDIQAYIGSNRASEAATLLSSPCVATQSTHTKSRNYLLTRIAFTNCHRTGCLTNMTLAQFYSGEKNVRNGHHVVCVSEHKTSSTYGPAEVVLDEDLYQDCLKYIKSYRKKSDSEFVFLSWNGKQMDSGLDADALSTELGHAGVEKKVRRCCIWWNDEAYVKKKTRT